ncbi:MAG: type II 3-dehydroquinate dehydratase [Chloroflexota bacterium]|nr:type II 3-dehydroquinate dehydratase [Chloroflexota bacterium]
MRILVIHGPNLNMLGIREPHIYGAMRLADLDERIRAVGAELGVEVECFQSNHEGAILDLIQARSGTGLAGAVINPGGLTHTSVALHDAIKAVDYPFVEVHLSNVHAREEFRRHSYVSPAARGVVAGLGWRGYEAAVRALVGSAREAAG